MKRTRRISVEIEHRELFVSVTRSMDARVTGKGDDEAGASTASTPVPDRSCPVCGSLWLLLLDLSSSPTDDNSARLQALLACGVHVYCSPSGELWACRQSFQQIKENF